MTEYIKEIRELLDALESEVAQPSDQTTLQNFDAFEIPEILKNIVDYLQPSLFPYEGAIYWYLFRHSLINTGQQELRVSVRGLTKSVIKSASGQSSKLSYSSVQKALEGLQGKGAIQIVGDTNREGTLYKIMLPEEIPLCQRRMKEVVEEKTEMIDVKKELDYYNVRENRHKIFERDNYKCHYCGKQLTRFTATLDHLQPVSKGGDNSYDNLIASCIHCNSRRGNRPVMDYISESSTS